MARVPHSEREEIVKLSLEGYSQRNIASLSGRPLKTVNSIVRAYRDEGRIKDAPQDRRPRSTTIDQDLMIVAAVNEDPFQIANSVRTALELDVSDTTVRRRLREAGMQSRVAAQKPLLTPSNKTVRLKFANDYTLKKKGINADSLWGSQNLSLWWLLSKTQMTLAPGGVIRRPLH
ncbi:hypothetical protein ISCGN_002763 [Ixodes scapularis]